VFWVRAKIDKKMQSRYRRGGVKRKKVKKAINFV